MEYQTIIKPKIKTPTIYEAKNTNLKIKRLFKARKDEMIRD